MRRIVWISICYKITGDENMNNAKNSDYKVIFWGCLGAILVPIISLLLIIACIYAWILSIVAETNQGKNYEGAMHQYHIAMQEGRGEDAVHWAERFHYFLNQRYKYRSYEHNNLLGNAYELNGEYEKALENYVDPHREAESLDVLLDVSRIEYKLNRKGNAFLGYCRYAYFCSIKYSEPLKAEGWNERNLALGEIRYPITMEQSSFMRLSPFLEYRDFLDFMEKGYQKLGEPPECAAAMELFRAIDTEIVEEHLPRPWSKLSDMREKILKERQVNKVME